MLLCRGVPFLNWDLEGSDAGGLRKLRVNWEEGIVGLLNPKVSHPGYSAHSETTEKPCYGYTVLKEQLLMTNILSSIAVKTSLKSPSPEV